MYHYIRVNPVASDQLGFGLSVTPNDFAAQMALLADSGYRTVSVPDVFNAAHGQNREKVIAITFDDGYADAYTAAYPILKARGMIATFYVISDFVGRPGYLNADQIREMAASGMIIGSHSVSHPDLSQIINPALQQQLSASRRALEEMVGLPVLDLCYPSGRYNEGVLVAARNAGYRTAVTTRYGLVVPGQSPLELFRIRVSGGQGAAGLAAALGDR